MFLTEIKMQNNHSYNDLSDYRRKTLPNKTAERGHVDKFSTHRTANSVLIPHIEKVTDPSF